MRRFHELPADEYARLDIGEVNLECADKLYGSENINVARYVAVLDEWAAMVARATDRAWHRFRRNPSEFGDSDAQFKMLVLVTVLQRDIGVSYALNSLEKSFDCTDSRLHFIHGIIEGKGGTCVTLPVLYIAIGRRLGYPLRLVKASEHLFVRWDDEETGERFNIEATSKGLVIRPDEYYYSWPKPAIMQHIRDGWLLRSFTPQEELSVFYETRARCYLDWMHFRSAMELAHEATRLGGGEANPYRGGFYAMVTVMYRIDAGIAKFGFKRNGDGFVVEMYEGKYRPMLPWEKWAIEAAEDELKRIEQLHVERRKQGKAHVRNRRIMQLADGPNAAVDTYFAEEVTG